MYRPVARPHGLEESQSVTQVTGDMQAPSSTHVPSDTRASSSTTSTSPRPQLYLPALHIRGTHKALGGELATH